MSQGGVNCNQDHLNLIQEFCENNKLQLVDHFHNFDLHNKKKIRFNNFVNVLIDFLGNFKVLHNKDINAIGEAYRDPEDRQNVN